MGCCMSTGADVSKCTKHNTPKWGITGTHTARVTDIYDGDTLTVALVPFKGAPAFQFPLRVDGVDTPELKVKKTDPHREEKIAAAVRARDATAKFCPVGSIVTLECRTGEKWKRVLAHVRNSKGENLTEYLIAGGFGVSYDGGKKG